MNKFSIIVPIYNVEHYLENCLESIVNQTYTNYECILVCDKSTDNSTKTAEKYAEKYNFKYIYKENTGLSKARNTGVNLSSGDYILFLDGDDYYEPNLLETLNVNLYDTPDLLRFQAREIFKDNTVSYNEVGFDSMIGTESFKYIINNHFVENAWLYCYNRKFYQNNNFTFMDDCIAEDYGLIPLIIARAKSIKSIDFIGYNYVKRENSLMNNNDYNKKIKKMNDMLLQSKFLKFELLKIENTNLFIRFINNSLIYYSTTLKYIDYKKYNKILKKEKCFDYLPNNTLKSKLKKSIIKRNSYIFYNYVVR